MHTVGGGQRRGHMTAVAEGVRHDGVSLCLCVAPARVLVTAGREPGTLLGLIAPHHFDDLVVDAEQEQRRRP